MWKDGQATLSEEASYKSSMHSMNLRSEILHVQMCTRHEIIMVSFWEKDGGMRKEYFFIFLKTMSYNEPIFI